MGTNVIMYKVVKRSRAVQWVILLLTLFVMLTIFPFRMWNETITSSSNQVLAGSSDSVGEDYLLQRFIAQYDHLGTINLYLTDFENGWNRDQRVDSFLFRMLDSDMQIMFEQEVDVRFIDVPGFCSIYINEDLEVARDYYFFLQGSYGSRVWFGLEETENAGTPYVSRLVYNYDELTGYNIIGEYNYSVPLRKDKVFLYDALLAVLALVLTGAVELYTRVSGKDRLVTVEGVLRVSANLLAGAGLLLSLWTISIRQFFSGQPLDNVFYTVGTLLAFATVFYAVNHKRQRKDYVPLFTRCREHLADILQVIFLAAAVWACCNYMNGLYEIHHRVAERQLMVFLALAAIVMCKKKDVCNLVTLIYAVAAAIGVWRYHSIYVDYLAMDEWDIRILRWGIAAAVLGGFLIVNIIRQLMKRERPARVNTGFCAALLLFFMLLIIFRNTRWWTVVLAAAYAVFYIRYALWDKKAHLLQNICNGLLLNFVCSMLFCFVRRPFLSWIYTRYPFTFHTVTITAVYMTFVMCAAFIKLTERYKRYQSEGTGRVWKYLWKELLLFGMTATYMLFTASRTGFLAVGALIVVVLVLLAAEWKRERLKKLGILIGVMAVSVVWCFPAVFTAQRILPAVCNNVYRHEVEVFPDQITRGNEWDSMYYITVHRFFEVFNNKIFDIPEDGSTSYERSAEYQEYRAKRFNNEGDVVWEGDIETAENAQDSDRTLNIIGIKTDEERAAEEAAAAQREKEALEGDFLEEEAVQEEVEDLSVYEKTEEYANGRMDIFRAYIDQLNMTGHEEMGAMLSDGSLAVHAHNIYLQAAYDHGIVVGVVFVLVGAAAFVWGVIYYRRRGTQVACAALPAAAVAAFAVAGLVEWIFHLCQPASLVLLLVLAPLLFDMSAKKDEANEK